MGSVFDLYGYDKISLEKIVEVDKYIIDEILKEDAELLKQYNTEFLVYKVNRYIENFVKEEQEKKKKVVKKRATRPKKEKKPEEEEEAKQE